MKQKFNKIIVTIMAVALLLSGVLPPVSIVAYAETSVSEIESYIKSNCSNYTYVERDSASGNYFYTVQIPVSNFFGAHPDIDVTDDMTGITVGNSKYAPTFVCKTKDGKTYVARFMGVGGNPSINGVFNFEIGTTDDGEYDVLSDGSGLDLTTAEVKMQYDGAAEEAGLDSLEKMLAALVTGIANAVNWILSIAIGRNLTIDDLVFNQYDMVELSYFKPSGSSKLIWGEGSNGAAGNGAGGLHETINQWYGIFREIAIIAYMMILVYMGIRILLSSTGEKKAQYKTLFVYWVIGVMLLFFYPFVMKYTIALNEAFVSIVASARSNNSIAPSSMIAPSVLDTAGLAGLDFDQSPFMFTNGDPDYMTAIARKAQESRRLALAVAYLIMTWQLITLTVHYYKRLLMVGFLIVIFPLVAASFAIDKVADGKSQSFNKWNKEFILNVFIQSFHAIVYVFVCNTVYEAGMKDGNYDFILVIVGATFLFTGEEIIKKIFSQDSPGGSVKSLAVTAATTMAAAQLAKNVVSKTTDAMVGKNSMLNRTRNAAADLKATSLKLDNFDKLAKPTQRPNAGLRLDGTQEALESINNDASLSESQRTQQRDDTMQLANAVADINNPSTRSAKELAAAYDTVQRALERDPNNAILRNMKLTPEQMQGMAAISQGVAAMVASGITDTVTIDREVKLKMGYVLDGLDDDTRTRYNTMFLTNMALHGVNRGFTRAGTEEEIDTMVDELEELDGSFRDIRSTLTTHEIEDIEGRESTYAMELMSMARASTSRDAANADKESELAKNLAIIKERSSGSHSFAEQLEALDQVIELRDTNDTTSVMVDTIDEDVDVMRHILAQKVVSSDSSTAEEKEKAQSIIEEYETDTRDGFYDDEVSVHDIIKHRDSEEEVTHIKDDIHLARRRTNQKESELTQDIAADILAENGVTLTEGGLDTETRYIDGQTREELLLQQKAEKGRVLKNLLGISTSSVDDELDPVTRYQAYKQFSDEEDPATRKSFWQAMSEKEGLSVQEMIDRRRQARQANYNAHFMGDQNNGNDNNE